MIAKEALLLAIDESHLKAFQSSYRSDLGVCCFTTDPLHELMWSHYADSGKGVWLEFRFKNNPEIWKKNIPVSYSNKRISVNNEIDRFKALFRKRTSWRYEKEWLC